MGARILLTGGGTGGHLYPALNLADALKRREPSVELFYLGARRGLEAQVLPGRGIPFRLLRMQPIYRSRPWRNWRLLVSAPSVVAGLARAFRHWDPGLVVGTGGYASGPPLAWAKLTGRSTALQEQNARPGLVTRWMAPRVDQIHLGFPEALEHLSPGPGTQTFTFGNPVAAAGTPSTTFDWPEGRVILVAGGSQGAAGLNRRLLADLEGAASWPENATLVWITGPAHLEAVRRSVDELPRADRIRVVPWIEELGAQLDRVDLAVARAGAMFVSELAAAGVPAILVPFPGAAGDHQHVNARALSEAGAALVREESDLAAAELWGLVGELLADRERLRRMADAAAARGAPDAADRIAAELLGLARRRGGARERV